MQALLGEPPVSRGEDLQDMAGAAREGELKGDEGQIPERPDGTAVGRHKRAGGPTSKRNGGFTSPVTKHPASRTQKKPSQHTLNR